MKYDFTVHADNCAAENILRVATNTVVKSYGNNTFTFSRDMSESDRDRMVSELLEIGSVTKVDVKDPVKQRRG